MRAGGEKGVEGVSVPARNVSEISSSDSSPSVADALYASSSSLLSSETTVGEISTYSTNELAKFCTNSWNLSRDAISSQDWKKDQRLSSSVWSSSSRLNPFR